MGLGLGHGRPPELTKKVKPPQPELLQRNKIKNFGDQSTEIHDQLKVSVLVSQKFRLLNSGGNIRYI